MHTLTLTFISPDAATIHLRAEGSLGGRWHGTFEPPFDAATLSAITRALEPNFDPQGMQETETVTTLKAAGLPLTDALPSTIGDHLDAALRASRPIANAISELSGAALARNEPLHLALEFDAGCDAVAALPWELLRHDGRFLVADNTIALTRSPVGAAPYTETLGELPLRILLVLSEPLGASPIAPERQARQLAHGLRDLAAEGAVVVDELRPPTYDALVEAVRGGGYHALHFYGHGVYHEGAGHLLFEDPYGGPDLVRADDVGAVLNRSDVRLVVMGACQSAMGRADQGSSTAAALLRAGVPLVVGMQVSMLVVAAQAFTRQFYLSLAGGKDVAQALGDARLPLRRAAYGKSWFIPALYSHALGEPRLFDPAARVARRTGEEIAQLRTLQAQVERLQEESSRLGVAQFSVEVAQLRAAQEELRQAQADWRQGARGGYKPVVSPLYGVPPRVPHFVGRVDAMQRVGRGLEGEQPVVIWGLGGIGKTALAIEAVHRHNWRYPGGVLWLDCRGAPPFDSLLNHVGAFCGHPQVQDMEPERRQSTVRALLSMLERPLLVWDNIEEIWKQWAVQEFIKTLPSNCSCLLTTRQDPEQSGWPTVELNELAEGEMADLFLALGTAAGVKVAAPDRSLIPRVLEWLQGHPLALTLAVPLAKKRGLARLWADLQRQPLKGVDAALRVSLERLNALQKRAFTCLSVFTIPFQYPAAEALLPNEPDVDEAVDTLTQRALLAFDGRSHSYHALVRQFAYKELQRTRDDCREAHRQAAEYLQAKEKDEGLTPVEALEEVDQWEQAEEWDTFARQASGLVGTLDRHGYWPEIEERLQRARGVVRVHLGDARLEAALSGNVAAMAWRQAEWDRAIEMYKCSLKTLERVGDVHSQAQMFSNLGLVYVDKGEWDQAINMYQCSLETEERERDVHGQAQTFNNLGLVYARKGEWDRAIKMYQRSLEIFKREKDVHGIAQERMNMGSVYYRKGKWDRAIEMYQCSLETFERAGDVHGIAQILNNLGLVYVDQGKWDRAIEMYQRSLKIKERVGDVHGKAGTWDNLGGVYHRKGEWDQAIEMYQRSLETKERVGDVHGMAQTWDNLGLLYLQTGREEEAKPLFAQAYLVFARMGSPYADTAAQFLIQACGSDEAANAYLADFQQKQN